MNQVPVSPNRARRRGIARWVLLAVLLLPILEAIVLVLVGKAIGLWWTLGLIVVVAFLGTWLARRETGRTLRALRQAMDSGRMPADEVTDAILIMVGGFLLLFPGFVSDVLALVLVLPFTRPVARRLLQSFVASRALGAVGVTSPGLRRQPPGPGRGQVIEGEIIADETPPWRDPGPERPPLDR